jgi:hypothetical protein
MPKVRFRQADVQRALRAAKSAGVSIDIKIEAATGDFIITTKDADGSAGSGTAAASALDQWMAKHACTSERH